MSAGTNHNMGSSSHRVMNTIERQNSLNNNNTIDSAMEESK